MTSPVVHQESEQRNGVPHLNAELSPGQRKWIERRPRFSGLIARALHIPVRTAMRLLFRLEVRGSERVTALRQMILTPNHGSSLDSAAIAAALPWPVVRRLRWAASRPRITGFSLQAWLARVVGAVPIDRDSSALDVAAAVLSRGEHLVWYPEGHRTDDGELQQFHRGIGSLMAASDIPVVPVAVHGAYDALPSWRWIPRLRQITVTFGEPVRASDIRGKSPEELADALQRRVARLLEAENGAPENGISENGVSS